MTNIKRPSAFSLIELSIVILIISILISGTLTVSRTSITNAQIKETKEKMDEIYEAIANFTAINKRLPCPASIATVKSDADYGSPATTTTLPCDTAVATEAALLTSAGAGKLVWGMVPTQALSLDNNMAEDGFGSKFSYVISEDFAQSYTVSTTVSLEGADATDTASTINIEELSSGGTVIADTAIFVLISHGPNKLGAYDANSSSQNASGTNEELDNQYVNTYDYDFVINATDTTYDDMLLYKNKSQIVRDGGMEFMICDGAESSIAVPSCSGNLGTWGDTEYGVDDTINCSTITDCTTGTIDRSCGKYGAWGITLNDSCT